MAQDFKSIDARMGAQKINETSTTQNHPLGTRIRGFDATDGHGEFIYLQGKANTLVGSWVIIDGDNYTTTLADADDIATVFGQMAVAMSANVANQYGWYAIYGKIEAQMAASFADDGKVYLTSTAGVCDDASVANCRVNNAKGCETIVSAGLAEVSLFYPSVDGDTD